jgi:hypothetical protein
MGGTTGLLEAAKSHSNLQKRYKSKIPLKYCSDELLFILFGDYYVLASIPT